MRMKFILCLALCIATIANAADLFENRKLRDVKPGDPVLATDTIGGYPIYQGEGKWTFEEGKTWLASGPSQLLMGSVQMKQTERSQFFSRLTINANLNQQAGWPGWSG